jgi:hypothetical protein
MIEAFIFSHSPDPAESIFDIWHIESKSLWPWPENFLLKIVFFFDQLN